MQIGDEEVLTLKQAEERIGVNHKTLHRQAKKGVLKAQLMGKTWLVTASELERYEREHKGKVGPKPGRRGSPQ
jgi:hypothetical protein